MYRYNFDGSMHKDRLAAAIHDRDLLMEDSNSCSDTERQSNSTLGKYTHTGLSYCMTFLPKEYRGSVTKIDD